MVLCLIWYVRPDLLNDTNVWFTCRNALWLNGDPPVSSHQNMLGRMMIAVDNAMKGYLHSLQQHMKFLYSNKTSSRIKNDHLLDYEVIVNTWNIITSYINREHCKSVFYFSKKWFIQEKTGKTLYKILVEKKTVKHDKVHEKRWKLKRDAARYIN